MQSQLTSEQFSVQPLRAEMCSRFPGGTEALMIVLVGMGSLAGPYRQSLGKNEPSYQGRVGDKRNIAAAILELANILAK